MIEMEHIEATVATVIETGDGRRMPTSFTVTATVNVRADSMERAVQAVERRLLSGQ